MVSTLINVVLLQPLGIYVIALGAGFLVPLFNRAHRGSAILVFPDPVGVQSAKDFPETSSLTPSI